MDESYNVNLGLLDIRMNWQKALAKSVVESNGGDEVTTPTVGIPTDVTTSVGIPAQRCNPR